MLRKDHSLSAKARAFAEQKPTLIDAPILSRTLALSNMAPAQIEFRLKTGEAQLECL